MKLSASLLFAVCTLATFAGSAHGALVYYNNFETYGLADMNGVDGWVTNDPTTNAGATVTGAGGDFGLVHASVGFVAPVVNTEVYVNHGTSTPLVGSGNATFVALFTIQDSDSGYNNPPPVLPGDPPQTFGAEARDTFGFRLKSGGANGTNLFSFFLNPSSQVSDPENQTAYNAFSWSTGIGAPTMVLDTPYPGLKAVEGFGYYLTVNFFDAGGGVAGFNADINGTGFSGTLGAGTASQTIDNFGAVWIPLNGPSSPGSNMMIYEFVPEPSAAMLAMLGASAGLVRRRRI